MTAARVQAWIPETANRAAWSSGAFLFYAGTVVMLISILFFLDSLNGSGDDFGLAGWTTLALALLVAAALLLRRAGLTILAGLAAFIGLIVFGLWVGSVEDWLGFGPDDTQSFFAGDFEFSLLLIEVLVIAVGLAALRVFRFPLLMLPIAVVAWYGLVSNVSLIAGDPGNDAHAAFSILFGLVLIAVAIWLDRSGRAPYAFWAHVVGGVTVGWGVLELLNDNTWQWAFAGLIALAYVAAARALARSSYAVVGAIGVVWIGGLYIEKWWSISPIPFFFGEGSEPADKWKGPLAYVVLGLILVVLGVLVDRGLRLRARPVAQSSP